MGNYSVRTSVEIEAQLNLLYPQMNNILSKNSINGVIEENRDLATMQNYIKSLENEYKIARIEEGLDTAPNSIAFSNIGFARLKETV